MSILIFEDAQVEQLAPVTTGRPACCVTVASYRLLDLLEMLGQPLCGMLRGYLQAIQRADYPQMPPVEQLARQAGRGPQLAINARVIPSAGTLRALRTLLAESADQSGIVWEGNQVAAVINPPWSWSAIAAAAGGGIESLLLSCKDLPPRSASLKLMTYPHDVIAANMAIFAE
ncbi:MAG: putative sugar nucleotidyl transferase, partial [Aureliella sp.]